MSVPGNLHVFSDARRLYHRALAAAEGASPYNTGVLQAHLEPRISGGGRVKATPGGWRFSIPVGKSGAYRLAQMDDYAGRARGAFPWRPPLQMALRARASQRTSPGTWGFGLWNDPFGLSLGFGGGARLPALPQAAWFFFASPENHLSLCDDQAGSGALAASIQSNPKAYALAPLGLLALPLILWRPGGRALRRLAAHYVRQESAAMDLDARDWHHFQLNWRAHEVSFLLDGRELLSTAISPRAPLGLVLWIDNQYAAWRPDGGLGAGALATEIEQWVEIEDLTLSD